MMLHKLRIALAVTILALAAVSAVDSALAASESSAGQRLFDFWGTALAAVFDFDRYAWRGEP
jgi:hypothetical protein